MLLPEKAKQIQRRKSEVEFSWHGPVLGEEVRKCWQVRRNNLGVSRDMGASSPVTVLHFLVSAVATRWDQAMGHSETLF